MCTVKEIGEIMDEIAPQDWAEEWDNVGLLLGNNQSQVKKLMVVLDVSPQVVEEAIKRKVDMIIAHHPLIFSPIKRVIQDDIEGQLISTLIYHRIAVYCAHTNLDMAPGGIDDSLAKILGLKEVETLYPQEQGSSNKLSFGRWGILGSPIKAGEFAKFVKIKLKTPNLNFIGDRKRDIKTIALCSGSGSDFMKQAQKVGADLFITGEIKYHDALTAHWLGIDLLTVGHFYSEMPGIEELIGRLQKTLDSLQYKVDVLQSETQKSPFSEIIID